jgi:hypothetical protein
MPQPRHALIGLATLALCCQLRLVASEPSRKSPDTAPPAGAATEVPWVRSGLNTDQLTWGIRGHLLWGLAPPTGQPADGPRGLIRLRYPVLADGAYDLLNFLAVEPVVNGHKGFSELEHSELDKRPGKRFWVVSSDDPVVEEPAAQAGQLTRLECGAEQLTVEIRIEPFANGAHVRLLATQRSDAPDEIQLTIHADPNSVAMEYCTLTATMGNKARARQLWLKDRVESSLKLYPAYRESGFAPHRFFALEDLFRTSAGDVLVAITTDESEPSQVEPFPRRVHWYYGGFPVTQYWRKPAGTWRSDLHAAVNARYTYWMSQRPIPGGISFENFELRERFHDGQTFVFGISASSPQELGFCQDSD